MKECMYQQNTSPKGCYYENKDHSVIFIECDTADCYYKQLKRAEIEIEKLKGVDGSVHPDSAYYKITRLAQENAELKAKVEELDKMTGIFSARLCEKYRKTLQEIKEIVSNIIDGYIRPYGDYKQLKKILDLITKAEVGE